jgi:hypothetical protein
LLRSLVGSFLLGVSRLVARRRRHGGYSKLAAHALEMRVDLDITACHDGIDYRRE